jgi:hypothetical protein
MAITEGWLGGEVELSEGGAGSFEVSEFHLGIFAGEDDAIGTAMEARPISGVPMLRKLRDDDGTFRC